MSRRREPPSDAPTCAPEPPAAEPDQTMSEEGGPAQPTADALRESAQKHAQKALETLVELAASASSEHVRVAAANAILDRALGKPLSGAKTAADGVGSETDGQGGVLEVRWLDDDEEP